MSTTAPSSVRRSLAILLTLLLAVLGLSLPTPTAAHAAEGDVAGATLQWGVKSTFRNYIINGAAHGHWTVSGVSDASPFSWSGGSGAAPGGTGTVAYPGSVRFQGHQGFGVPADEYALDLTFSDLKVRVLDASTAQLIVDASSRGFSDPTTFLQFQDVVLASLDLSAGTPASGEGVVGWSGVPATLTAEGAPAFGGFYSAGEALDPVSFSWPVEAAPEPEPEPEPEGPVLTVSKTEALDPEGETVTVSGSGYDPAVAMYLIVCRDIPLEELSLTFAMSCVSGSKMITPTPTSPTMVQLEEDGSFTTELAVADSEAFAAGAAIYTLANHSDPDNRVQDAKQPISFAAPEPEGPVLTVSKTTGLDPAGETVTVSGSGYNPEQGMYLIVCRDVPLDEVSFAFATPCTAGSKLITPNPTRDTMVQLEEDGSFTTEFTVAENPEFTSGTAIYTLADHTAREDRSQDAKQAISFATAPTITVSQTEDLESGDVVTVTGTGFGPDESGAPLGTRPPLAGRFAGVYVSFGTFADVWKPSEDAPRDSRVAGPDATKWVVAEEDVETLGSPAAVAIGEDGSFSLELTVTEGFEGALADGNYGIYTYPGSGAVYAPFETYTPIAFATGTTPTEPPVDPGVEPTPGSLSWGVKASFRNYVTGPIAHGSISVGGGAGAQGGSYWFPQASLTESGGVVTAGYRGSVTFSGHDGALSLRLADPIVRVTSTSTGVLSVVAGGGRVDFATLNLAAASVSTDATGARTFAGAPATLTSAGAASFAGFYGAGEPLDPVTFTVGSTNQTSGRATTIAALAPAPSNLPASTPPATEGVESEDDEFVEGGEYTFTADGFEPGEEGILAVIYSSPTVLADDLVADAAGAVEWTGMLPRGLTGEHTFTFQGSVDRGIVIDIAAAEVVGCTVEAAELRWGFKESFRAYIDGSIANGEWTTADGAAYETPVFIWSDAAGGYDAESGDADVAFTGSVRFTGHGGVLDTTIADPRVVIDGDRAVLLLDVTGTTQDGEAVSATGVEFAELDLEAAEPGGGGDLVAFSGIPATLTAAGAEAFGTYPAGEALDALDLRITIDPVCAQPAVDEEETPAAADPEPASDVVVWPWIVLAVLLALVIAGVVLVLVRRARA